MTKAVALRKTAIDVLSFDNTGVTLESTRVLNFEFDGIRDSDGVGALGPDGRLYFDGDRFGPRVLAVAEFDGNTITTVTPFTSPGQFPVAAGMAFDESGTRMFVAMQDNNTVNSALFDISQPTPVLLDSARVASDSSEFLNSVAWIGGTRFCVATNNGNGQAIIDITADQITEIARGGIEDSTGDTGTAVATVGRDLVVTSVPILEDDIIVDLSADAWVEIARHDGSLDSNVFSPAVDGKIWSDNQLLDWDGTSLTFNRQIGDVVSILAVNSEGDAALYRSFSNQSTISLQGLTGEVATLALTSKIFFITSEYFSPLPSGPATPEELFQASYADASAAPPKITALIRPADVQRSIDTDVSNLVGGPDFYTVEEIFDIGELSDLRQDKLYFVRDDQPGLRDGKLLRLKRYQIRDGDPAVPVTCTFWG